MRKMLWAIPAVLLGFQFTAAAEVNTVPAGTEVTVRTNQYIDARNADGRIYTGTLDRDVLDRDGRVAIPRGSEVELIARRYNRDEMALDLDSITAFGHRYTVAASDQSFSGGREKPGVGENERTAKYLGGGAIIGSIIGAIAGGGKGAAIGAAAGAATGAGAQMATRGREIRVPAESLLTFRLDRPIHVVQGRDPGYMRDGYHYHNYPPQQDDRYRP
jgi:hypothetical protein